MEYKILAPLLAIFRNIRAATAIEYGLIAAGVALVILAAVNGTGANLSGIFDKVSGNLVGSCSGKGCVTPPVP